MAKNDELDFPILVCIATAPAGQPRHGYAICKTLEQRLNVQAAMPSVYRAIDRLVERGLVERRHAAPEESHAGSQRKPCSLSSTGRVEVRQLKVEHQGRAERTAAIVRYLTENWHDADDRQPAA